MTLKDISFESPEENILFDEVLFDLAEKEKSGEVLRLWESSRVFVVLGRIGKVEDDLNVTAITADQIPVLRRCSGGGTVLQGRGCFNYTLVLSKEVNPKLADLKRSYEIILAQVVDVLGRLNIDATFLPISDIALLNGLKKVSGNAQKRGRKFILHHGTILYDFDLSLIEKYLKFPKDVPEYRRLRGHLEFVDNIHKSKALIKAAFCEVFKPIREENQLTALEKESLASYISLKKATLDLSLPAKSYAADF